MKSISLHQINLSLENAPAVDNIATRSAAVIVKNSPPCTFFKASYNHVDGRDDNQHHPNHVLHPPVP